MAVVGSAGLAEQVRGLGVLGVVETQGYNRQPIEPCKETVTLNDSYEPPKPSAGDDAHALGRSALGAIPFAGTAAVELFNIVITPSIERRRDEWREMVRRKLGELEQRQQVTIEELQQNEDFQTAILQASHIAIRTHSAEKREALCNAVLNTALRTEPNESRRELFLSLIDRFTPTHLKMLSIMDNPRKQFENLGIDPKSILPKDKFGPADPMFLTLLPDWREEQDIYFRVVADLHAVGLVPSERIDVKPFQRLKSQITDLGKRFMRFVLTPPQTD